MELLGWGILLIAIAGIAMLWGMFAGGKKTTNAGEEAPPSYANLTIKDAHPGDVILLADASEMGEDVSLTVNKRHEYEGSLGRWSELAGDAAGELRHVEINEDDGLTVLLGEPGKIRLSDVNLSEDDLVRMDETHNDDETVTYNDRVYRYQGSGEMGFQDGGRGAFEGFYLWDFATDDGRYALSVEKWEGEPFSVAVSRRIDPSVITVFRS